MVANTFRQTSRFIATLATSLPEIPSDIMQSWIQNPRALQGRLKTLFDVWEIPQLKYLETRTFDASPRQVGVILEGVSIHQMNDTFTALLEASSYHLDQFTVDSFRPQAGVMEYEPLAIIAELGSGIEILLSHFASLVALQPKGDSGVLDVEGGNNLAYISVHGQKKAIAARWSREHQGWVLGVYEIGDVTHGGSLPAYVSRVITAPQK